MDRAPATNDAVPLAWDETLRALLLTPLALFAHLAIPAYLFGYVDPLPPAASALLRFDILSVARPLRWNHTWELPAIDRVVISILALEAGIRIRGRHVYPALNAAAKNGVPLASKEGALATNSG